MTDPTSRDLDALTAEPDDLDGHTIEGLADYVDRGRDPVDPSIESSPACRRAIAALQRLRTASATFLADAPDDPGDDAWVEGIMRRIAKDARAGADFTLLRTAEGDEIVMTEGALRALVRAAGDDVPGFLVGRVRFDGDLSAPSERLVVALDVVVAYGVVVPDGVDRLRERIRDRLALHTRFRDPRIDVVVRDLTDTEGIR